MYVSRDLDEIAIGNRFIKIGNMVYEHQLMFYKLPMLWVHAILFIHAYECGFCRWLVTNSLLPQPDNRVQLVDIISIQLARFCSPIYRSMHAKTWIYIFERFDTAVKTRAFLCLRFLHFLSVCRVYASNSMMWENRLILKVLLQQGNAIRQTHVKSTT